MSQLKALDRNWMINCEDPDRAVGKEFEQQVCTIVPLLMTRPPKEEGRRSTRKGSVPEARKDFIPAALGMLLTAKVFCSCNRERRDAMH
jgi:hypothetical protein